MSLVEIEQRGTTALLWLNRPPVNALSRDMRDAIREALGRAEREGWVHAAVLVPVEGLGFCAGADLAESSEIRSPEDAIQVATREVAFCEAVCRFPKPLIAALDRYALGGGLEFALAADWRLATARTKIGFPEAVLGAFPAGGAIPLATQLIGPHRTRQLMMTGEVVTGDRALALGLVDEVVDQAALLDRAQAVAQVFTARSYGSIRAVKALTGASLSGMRGAIVEWMRIIYAGRDIHEGLRAFHEKRPPEFEAEWRE
jgi:enoyl-CoA hydratase/carnithine racemase